MGVHEFNQVSLDGYIRVYISHVQNNVFSPVFRIPISSPEAAVWVSLPAAAMKWWEITNIFVL